MNDGFWRTYYTQPESFNERVFEITDQLGNILAATWVAEETWARIEVMGHRTHVGRVRALPHGWLEATPLKADGTFGAPSRYGSAAIFAIHDLTEEEAREEVRPWAPEDDESDDVDEDGNPELPW